MIYRGEFYSIDGREYRVELETETPGNDVALKLGGTPFVASVKSDGKTVYAPIRCGGATVAILSESYVFDLYSGQAKGVKVRLYEGERVEWTGYVTPTAYDQGYDSELEEIQLDCVDGLAVLKDIPFRTGGENTVMTFLDIITHCLKESGCYTGFYVTRNVRLTLNDTVPVIEKLRISTANFFDERKDMKQTEDDLAWSCYDVLFELMQWLGYTVVAEGGEVYIIDYDAIKAGDNNYTRYPLTGSAGPGITATKGYSHAITGESYAGNGTKLSLAEVYNKVTVKDEFNTYDDLFPQFGDKNFETNLTALQDSGDNLNRWHIPANPDRNFLEPAYLIIFRSDNWRDEKIKDEEEKVQVNILRFYDSPVFNFIKYTKSAVISDATNNAEFSEGNFKYSSMTSVNGGFYVRLYSTLITRKKYTEWLSTRSADNYKAFCELLNISDLSNLTLNPVIVMLNEGDYRIGPGNGIDLNAETDDDKTKSFPCVTLKGERSSSIFGGKNHILRIKGKFRYHARITTPLPLEFDLDMDKHGEDAQDRKYGNQGYIWCKVKWGDQYWDGVDWRPSDCWFKLWFWDEEEVGSTWKNWNHYNKDFEFIRNANVGYAEDGYIIPCPTSGNLEGTAEVSFTTRDMRGLSRHDKWKAKGTKSDNFYCRNYSNCVFLTDLSITAEVSPGVLSDADLDSDTCYTNVIDNGSVSPMGEITFKVCTDDGKKPSYSSVDTLEGGVSKFVTATFNNALYESQKGTVGDDGIDGKLRQEEHMVFKLATQYEKTRVVFKCDLHNDGHMLYGLFSDKSLGEDKRFVMTERETDYRFNSSQLTLTEKA